MAIEKSQHEHKKVDPSMWKACAGSLIHIPKVNSRVYYFPQGHIEQSETSITLSSMAVNSKSAILCRVLDVSYFADKDSDEVFVKFRLEPVKIGGITVGGFQFDGGATGGGEGGEEDDEVVSFMKVLTASDANNGGGFSVPRFCADSIFPPLDLGAEPPVQNIRVTDIHGVSWEFRHIYRGTPRRHLLTTGWSKFVNSKSLIAGDSAVFMKRKKTNELFVGIRRLIIPRVLNDAWGFFVKETPPAVEVPTVEKPTMEVVTVETPIVVKKGFSRSCKGRVPAKKVMEGVERAEKELEFEVVYYPRAGLPEFVVAAEKVEVAWGVYWSAGIRVKLAQETDDGSRLTWYNGTVASVVQSDHGSWRGSLWRMLEVAWDEPVKPDDLKTVSPWQVELIAPTPSIPATFPPTKKFKGMQNSGLLSNGEGDPPLPSMGLSSMIGQLSPSYLNFNTFPAGMQGARQIPFFLRTSIPNIVNDDSHQANDYSHKANDDSHQANDDTHQANDDTHQAGSSSQKMETISTDLNIGSSPLDTSSPESQNSVQFFGVTSTDLTKKNVTSFQLFGKIIHLEQPLAIVGDTIEGANNALENFASDSSRSAMEEDVF